MPPTLDHTFHQMRTIWSWTLATPIIYLLVGRVMDYFGWVSTFPEARHPWDTELTRLLLGMLAAALVFAVIWLRVNRRRSVLDRFRDLARAEQRWVWYFYWMVALADALAFLGLVYFMLSGKIWVLLAAGGVTYLCYALAYPMRKDLIILMERVRSPEPG